MRKNILKILINTLIGIFFIFLWLKLVNVSEVYQKLSQINLFWCLPFIAFFVLANFLRSVRLKILLSSHKIPLLSLFYLTNLGQFLSFLIPLRLGEFAKGVYLSTHYKLPLSKSVVWIFMDRFLDFWMVLVLSIILLLIVPVPFFDSIRPILFVMIMGITLVSILIIFFPNFTNKIFKLVSHLFLINILKKYFTQLTEFIIDASAFLRKSSLETAIILILTVLAIISEAMCWFILFKAVFGANLSFVKIWLGSLLSALTYLIPSAPGYVGSAEASSLVVFNLGLGEEISIVSAAGVLFHILTLVCILVLGISSLYLLKFDMKLVWGKFKK